MKSTIDSDFGLALNPGSAYRPRRILSTSADLYENVQVHIPTKEELKEHEKRMIELIKKYYY
jgi:hypothetical protein